MYIDSDQGNPCLCHGNDDSAGSTARFLQTFLQDLKEKEVHLKTGFPDHTERVLTNRYPLIPTIFHGTAPAKFESRESRSQENDADCP